MNKQIISNSAAAAGMTHLVNGFDINDEAIRDANLNASQNRISNAEFHVGDLSKIIHSLNALSAPDVVITDPNRPGMHPDLVRDDKRRKRQQWSSSTVLSLIFLSFPDGRALRFFFPFLKCSCVFFFLFFLITAQVKWLNSCRARRIVYIACNPTTQARDVAMLCQEQQSQYRLVKLQPLDMFPHTPHIENIAILDKITS